MTPPSATITDSNGSLTDGIYQKIVSKVDGDHKPTYQVNGEVEKASPTNKEPLKLSGVLDQFKSFDVTPVIGREYPDVDLAGWLKAPNSDELIRDLAITGLFPSPNNVSPDFLLTHFFEISLSKRRCLFPIPEFSG